MKMRFIFTTLPATVLLILLPSVSLGRNVDLSTVPKRDTVQLTIYNSEDLTLVRETRTVTFRKGANPLQFSWANTLIDPTSVELRFLSDAEKLEVLDTTYPHDKPQMLYWNVQSDFDGPATIEITYFTSGITWRADYLCTADQKEATAHLQGFVRITNGSGEDYENAHVRLVVGTINLVEKIAQLARVSVDEVLRRRDLSQMLEKAAAKDFMKRQLQEQEAAGDVPMTAPAAKPKEIVKQGLSEYFIFSIAGTETIPDGWSKRMRSFDAPAAPLKIVYRYRPREYGEALVRMYLITNDKGSTLGASPLPDGVVRVMRENGRDGLSYLTAQPTKYIPIGDKIELNLGTDPRVVFDLVKLRVFRDQIWMRWNGTDVLRRVEDGVMKIEAESSVAGWDEHQIMVQRIRNSSSTPIDVEVRRSIPGDIIFRSELDPALHDYQTVELKTTVEAGNKADLIYEMVQHEGQNERQNRVKLENAKPAS